MSAILEMDTKVKKGYKLTALGEIPKDWEVAALYTYLSFISYGFTNPMPISKSGIFLITAKDIDAGNIQYSKARKTTKWAFEKLLTAKSKPRKNDLLLTKDGSLGRLAIVNNTVICINQSVAVMRTNNKIDSIFLKNLLESAYYQKVMLDNAGGSTIKHIYITIVDKMLIAAPSYLSEQQAIAEVLSDTNTLLQSLERQLEKKRLIKQGAMQELLRPKAGWEEKKLGEIGTIIRGASPRPQGDKRFYGGNIPRLMVEDVTRDGKFVIPKVDFLTSEGAKRSRPCKAGTLTVVCSGTVGVPSILGVDACIHDGFLGLIEVKKKYSIDYLYHQLSTLRSKFESSATHGGIFTNLTTSGFKEFEVSFPPKNNQDHIAEVLSKMDLELFSLNSKITKYNAIKSGLMQQLLTGKIRLVK